MDENKKEEIERIAKNIVGMGYQTSGVIYDENRDVRPFVTAFIKGIRDYVATLQFNGTEIALQEQFEQTIPRFNVTYTSRVTDRITGQANTATMTTGVTITLLARMIYDTDAPLTLNGYQLSAGNTYTGILYAEIMPNMRLLSRELPATTSDPICNVELSSSKPNNVILDDSVNSIEAWLGEVEVLINNKFRNNAHTRSQR